MLTLDHLIRTIDWFIPSAAKTERSELSLARNSTDGVAVFSCLP
jgi:hypothetical protein